MPPSPPPFSWAHEPSPFSDTGHGVGLELSRKQAAACSPGRGCGCRCLGKMRAFTSSRSRNHFFGQLRDSTRGPLPLGPVDVSQPLLNVTLNAMQQQNESKRWKERTMTCQGKARQPRRHALTLVPSARCCSRPRQLSMVG